MSVLRPDGCWPERIGTYQAFKQRDARKRTTLWTSICK